MERRADRKQQSEGLVAVEQPEQHRNPEHAPLPARKAFGVRSRDVGCGHVQSPVCSEIRDEGETIARLLRRSTRAKRTRRDFSAKAQMSEIRFLTTAV